MAIKTFNLSMAGCCSIIKNPFLFVCLLICLASKQTQANSSTTALASDLYSMSLQDLLKVPIRLVSGSDEKVMDVATKTIIITDQDIQHRGYRYLNDVLEDLNNVHNVITEGAVYSFKNVRGISQAATLFMIDGKVVNDLWDYTGHISRNLPLLNVQRVEVLIGPASAVYGANAALMIFNVVTKKGADLEADLTRYSIKGSIGSFSSNSLEFGLLSKKGDWDFAVSARYFESDGEDLSGRWGFLDERYSSDRQVWGPILDVTEEGRNLSKFGSPAESWGLMLDIGYKNWRAGYVGYKQANGYGPRYAADRALSNVVWNTFLDHIYVSHETQLTDALAINSTLDYRITQYRGDWAESLPFPGDPENLNLVSFTTWNSKSDSLQFKSNSEYKLSDTLTIYAGINYEKFDLNLGYDIPGYFGPVLGTFSSTVPNTDPGLYGFGAGIGLSTDPIYTRVPRPTSDAPSANTRESHEKGFFIQPTWRLQNWVVRLGSRYDDNSIYGSQVNNRGSVIYRLNDFDSLISSYNEAFTAPAPILLSGAFSARNANPDAQPMETKTLSFRWQRKRANYLSDVTLFHTLSQNTFSINTDDDARSRGVEFRFKTGDWSWFGFSNAFIDYSYTDARQNQTYDYDTATWQHSDWKKTGTAPEHLFKAGISLSISSQLSLFTNLHWFSDQLHQQPSPLRRDGKKVGSSYLVNTTLNYQANGWLLSFRASNLFDNEYLDPIPVAAESESGDDFENRSLGVNNSRIAQPGRHLHLALTVDF